MIDAIIKGLALSLLLLISVGPLVFTVLKHSIINGKEGGFSFITGIWISDLLIVIIANLFSELVTELLGFKRTIGVTGSIFLAILGIYYLFFKKIEMRDASQGLLRVSTGKRARLVLSGFLMNSLNPGVFAFWLTTSTTIAISNTVRERIVIFGTCIVINLGGDILKVVAAQRLSRKLTHKTLSLITKVSGSLLILFGIILLLGVLYADNL